MASKCVKSIEMVPMMGSRLPSKAAAPRFDSRRFTPSA